MGKTLYVVQRDLICGGVLIGNMSSDREIKKSTFENFDDDLFSDFNFTVTSNQEMIYRAMLFQLTNSGLSHDLIYTSPKYRVNGFECPYTSYGYDAIIKNYLNLGELLKEKHYGEFLTLDELVVLIKKICFDDKWIREVAELYGYKGNDDGSFYPLDEGILPPDGFRLIREMKYAGSCIPCVFEPNFSEIHKRKRKL